MQGFEVSAVLVSEPMLNLVVGAVSLCLAAAARQPRRLRAVASALAALTAPAAVFGRFRPTRQVPS